MRRESRRINVKDFRYKQISLNKLVIILAIVIFIGLIDSLTASADRRDDVLDAWRGTYYNGNGIDGFEEVLLLEGFAEHEHQE